MTPEKQIEDCKYIYLSELSEPKDNCLRIIIEEAKAQDSEQDIKIGDVTLSGVNSIESNSSCRIFEIFWPEYVSYCVTNESYSLNGKTEEYTGHLFRLYSKSHFLEHVERSTYADEILLGDPMKHWCVNCLNHTIDIISHKEPQIKLVPRQRD